DGDGIPDLVAGGEAAANGLSPGIVVVASSANGATIRTHDGTANGFFGASVAGTPDANHDGIDDYIVGEPYGGTGIGRATVLSGADGTQLYELLGTSGKSTNQMFGFSVVGGDFNRDGIGDIVVGDPSFAVLVRG